MCEKQKFSWEIILSHSHLHTHHKRNNGVLEWQIGNEKEGIKQSPSNKVDGKVQKLISFTCKFAPSLSFKDVSFAL